MTAGSDTIVSPSDIYKVFSAPGHASILKHKRSDDAPTKADEDLIQKRQSGVNINAVL